MQDQVGVPDAGAKDSGRSLCTGCQRSRSGQSAELRLRSDRKGLAREFFLPREVTPLHAKKDGDIDKPPPGEAFASGPVLVPVRKHADFSIGSSVIALARGLPLEDRML